MNRRQFAKRGTLTLALLVMTTTAWKCGSEKVTIYVQTISSFLREIAGIIPAQAAFINKIIGVAADLDAAYRRGDFDNATTFLESLSGNINLLITNLGVNLSSQVKLALALINSSVKLIAVLLLNQSQDPTVAAELKNRAAKPDDERKMKLIRSLANETDINALFEASKQ